MTKEEIERLERELAEAKAAHVSASELERAKRHELDEARAEYARINPHPMIGKAVERQVRRRGGNKTITQRGTVKAYSHKAHRGLRGLSYIHLRPGDLVVVSKSGATAWPFNPNLRRGEAEWQENSK